MAADQKWDARRWADGRLLELEQLPPIVDRLPGKKPLDHRHALPEDRHPAVHRHADRLVLFRAAAERHAQSDAPAGEMVEGRDLAGDDGGGTERDDEDGGAELDPARARG